MKVVRKLNNNVAVCVDDNGEQLVAFSKGIGFPKTPYELTDLSKITMTFYNLDIRYFQMLKEISPRIFDVSTEIVKVATKRLDGMLNPNLLFTMADHISFAIQRYENSAGEQFLFSYDVEQLYPKETMVGRLALDLIHLRLGVELPESEITSIAMHLVNSKSVTVKTYQVQQSDEYLIQSIASIFEQEVDVTINKKSFDYHRFEMHLRYLLKRMREPQESRSGDIGNLFYTMKEDEPEIYFSAKRMSDFLEEALKKKNSDEEIFYLMLYIKRIKCRLSQQEEEN